MANEKTIEKIEMPQGLSANFVDENLLIKGPKGETKLKINAPFFQIKTDNESVSIITLKNTKRERQLRGTLLAHVKNMIKGVTEGHKYVLKICSGHFPMTVTISGQDMVVKNFLGEKSPRKLTIPTGVKATVKGTELILEGCDRGDVGNVCNAIEKLTQRTSFDKRIFQDGIILVEASS